MIYLAQPYSHSDPVIQESRYSAAMYFCHLLFKANQPVYSPIIHWHNVARIYDLPGDAATWHNFNIAMLNRARKLYLMRIDGWRESRGVYTELVYAYKIGLPVYAVDFRSISLDNIFDLYLTSPMALMRESVHHGIDNSERRIDPSPTQGNDAG